MEFCGVLNNSQFICLACVALSPKYIISLRLNPNISKYWEFGELKELGYGTKSDIYPNMAPSFLLLHVITNEKSLKFTQIGIVAIRLPRFPAETRSNNSGRYTC